MKTNKCKYCGAETTNALAFFPMTLIIKNYEEQKLLYNNDWERMEKEMSPEEFDALMFYDQLLNTIEKGCVCNECSEKDSELYNKYYDTSDEFELMYCDKCIQMTNHLNGVSQKCAKLKDDLEEPDLPF